MSPQSVAGLLVLLIPLTPLALAGAVAWPRSRGAALRLVPWAALPAVLAALFLPTGARWAASGVLLGTELVLEGTGRSFLLLTSLLWLLAGFYGRTYLAGDQRRAGFFGAWLLTLAGNLGLVVAQDVLSFYLFFALMSFASYPLVIHDRSASSLRAGRVYVALVILGEILLFTGILLAAQASEGLALAEVARGLARSPHRVLTASFLLLGFGIKAGVVPLHVWLPLAHPAAPTPASAVLSGAMIKAGLLGWLRFLPPGEAGYPVLGMILAAAGTGTAFYGVAVGLCQRNPKALLAYSSVSQMGLMALAFGVGLAEPVAGVASLAAVTGYALHHGLAKGALFLGVGVTPPRTEAMRWLLYAGWVLPALALAGAPLTSGAGAKIALKTAAAAGPGRWQPWLGILLPAAALGTTLLVARFLVLVWRDNTGEEAGTPLGLWGPWLGVVAASLATHWVWGETVAFSLKALAPGYVWANLWPLLLGVGISAGVVFLGWRAPRCVPPGDLLALSTPLNRGLLQLWSGLRREVTVARDRWHATLLALPVGTVLRAFVHLEERVCSRRGAGAALLGLLLLALLGLLFAP